MKKKWHVRFSVSNLPIISAVGHETDVTIADFVADLRAPTPSAAAELVSRNQQELLQQLAYKQQRLEMALDRILVINNNVCNSYVYACKTNIRKINY